MCDLLRIQTPVYLYLPVFFSRYIENGIGQIPLQPTFMVCELWKRVVCLCAPFNSADTKHVSSVVVQIKVEELRQNNSIICIYNGHVLTLLEQR